MTAYPNYIFTYVCVHTHTLSHTHTHLPLYLEHMDLQILMPSHTFLSGIIWLKYE